MTLLNLDALGPAELISQYVIQLRGKGHTLPYDDYEFINQWLNTGIDSEQLLLVLSDILPELYENEDSAKRIPSSLRKVHKRVMKKIQHCLMLSGPNRKVNVTLGTTILE